MNSPISHITSKHAFDFTISNLLFKMHLVQFVGLATIYGSYLTFFYLLFL